MKIGLVASAGVVAGILLAGLLGETALNFGLAFTGLGIKQVDFIINPFVNYLLVPIVFIVIALFVTWSMLKARKRSSIVAIVNE